jgi:hypothetical protein
VKRHRFKKITILVCPGTGVVLHLIVHSTNEGFDPLLCSLKQIRALHLVHRCLLCYITACSVSLLMMNFVFVNDNSGSQKSASSPGLQSSRGIKIYLSTHKRTNGH